MPYETTVRALHERLADAIAMNPEVADYLVTLGQNQEDGTSPWSGRTFRYDDERELELEVPG